MPFLAGTEGHFYCIWCPLLELGYRVSVHLFIGNWWKTMVNYFTQTLLKGELSHWYNLNEVPEVGTTRQTESKYFKEKFSIKQVFISSDKNAETSSTRICVVQDQKEWVPVPVKCLHSKKTYLQDRDMSFYATDAKKGTVKKIFSYLLTLTPASL